MAHPRDQPRFDVRIDKFPGGWPRWRREFKQAAANHFRSDVGDVLPDDDTEPPPTPGHYAHQQLYYEIKSRVNAAAHQVAREAGVPHRDLSHWLVKEHGFPWRQDCLVPDLLRLLAFLQDPATLVAARSALDPDRVVPERYRVAIDGDLAPDNLPYRESER